MIVLNNSETALLESLALYKFLTNPQIESIGVKKGASNVRVFTKRFMDKHPGLIERLSMGVQAQAGRIPHLYYLTPKGAQFVEESLEIPPEKIKFPAAQSVVSFRDYAHRVSTIDFFISLRKWAESQGFDVLFTDAYFDKIGASRGTEKLRARTKIDLAGGYIIPDGAAMLDTIERKHLFLLEVYNGMDTKRVMEQLGKHLLAIADGSPSVKYGFDRGNFVAVVFDSDEAKNAVLSRMREDSHFKEFSNHFKFKTIAGVKESFYDGWELFNGLKINFI
jgi:hypothetical protein